MPARSRWREGAGRVLVRCAATGCAAVAASVLAAPAGAQLLDLDAPAAPKAGEGAYALGLAQELFEDIERREKSLERLTGERLLANRFEIANRRLIRALLMKAEEIGEAGSAHALVGLTLHNRLRELDLIARRLRAGTCSPAEVDAAGLYVARVERLHPLVPARVEELDRAVQGLLAVPVHTGLAAAGMRDVSDPPVWAAEPGRVGWMATAGGEGLDLGAACARWAGEGGEGGGGVPSEVVAAIAAFDEQTLREARGWWAYRAAAEAVAGAIMAAGRVVDEGGLPEWVPAEARGALGARFGAAAGRALEPATREGAMAELADLAACADALSTFDALASAPSGVSRPSQRAAAAARTAALAIVAATEAGSPGARAALGAFAATLRLIGERRAIGDERSLVRDARPAWRALEGEARRTEADLWDVLGAISPDDPTPMSNPVIVAPLGAHRRSLDDLLAVAAISRHLGAPGEGPAAVLPGAAPPPTEALRRGLVLPRVLRMGQDLAVPERREAALASLRRLAADLEELMAFPGEAGLRLGGAELDAVTGGRTAELVQRIDAARGRWLEALAREGDGAAEAEDLRRCRALAALVRDGATARTLLVASRPPGPGERFMRGDEGGIRAHPAWEVSDRAAAALYGDLGERIERATRLLLDGGGSSAKAVDAAVEEMTAGSAAVRLAAALERAARERRLAAAPVMVELAAPPAPQGGAWPAPLRGDLAAICRYAEELAHAAAEGDEPRARALRAYLNDRAAAALGRLAATEPAA